MKGSALINSNKGEGIVWVVFSLVLFLVMWFVFLADWIKEVGRQAINNGGFTGIEAFAYGQLNFIIFIIVILFIMGYAYFGASQ